MICVVLVLLGLPRPELLLELSFVGLDAAGNVFERQVILHLGQFYVHLLRFGDLECVNMLVLWLDLVFATPHVDDLCDVQTFDQVVGHDVGRTDDDIIDIFHRQRHQYSLLQALQGILRPSVVLDQFIVPQADIEKIPLLFRGLEPSNDARVHQVAAGLEVNDCVGELGLALV